MSVARGRLISLAALAVAAAAVIGVHVWLDVLPAAKTKDPPVVVESSVEVSGQAIRLEGAEWREFEAPEGSQTLSIRFRASGGADAASCQPLVLTESRGDRVWLDARTDLDVPFDAGEKTCREESGAYDILAVFLLPEDAEGPFWLDVVGADEDVYRFAIEP